MPYNPPMSQDPRTPKTPGDKACRRRRQARPGRMSGPALTRLKHTEMARKTTRGKLTLMSGDGPKVPNASPEPPDRDDWRTTFRPDIPSSARIYDYFLGGKDNYPADRDAGDQITAYLPNIREAAQINRAFVRRAVRYLVNEAGIRQLIDIGTGLPTMGNVHEAAMATNPATRVVYVDHDPIVLAHARNMCRARPTRSSSDTTCVRRRILADPELRRLVHFDEPVGVMFVSVLHFLSDADDPAAVIGDLPRRSRRVATRAHARHRGCRPAGARRGPGLRRGDHTHVRP